MLRREPSLSRKPSRFLRLTGSAFGKATQKGCLSNVQHTPQPPFVHWEDAGLEAQKIHLSHSFYTTGISHRLLSCYIDAGKP